MLRRRIRNGSPNLFVGKSTTFATFVAVVACFFATPTFADDDEKPIAAEDPKLGRPVEFDRDVYPILEANCIACHNKATNEGDLILEDTASITKGGSSGPGLIVGKPDESLLFVVASRQDEPMMPPLPNDVKADALTGKQVGILRQWILEGAKTGSGRAKQLAWQPLPEHLNAIYATALDPWGRYAAAGRANRITVYDLASGTEAARLSDPDLLKIKQSDSPMYGPTAAHRDFVQSLAFSPDGTMLASGGYRTVKLWQREANARHHEIKPGQTITSATTHGEWTALALSDNSVHLYKTADGSEGTVLKGHTATIRAMAFSIDGGRLVSGSDDKTVRIWSTADGKQLASVETPTPTTAVTFSLANTFVFTASADNVIRKWAIPAETETVLTSTGELKGPGKPITALVALPNADQIVSASADGNAHLWDAKSNKQVRAFALGSPATAIAVQADGARIAITGNAGVTKVFTTNDGKMVFELKTDHATDANTVLATEGKTIGDQRVAIADAAVKETEKDLKSREEAVKKSVEAKDKAAKAIADPEKKSTAAAAAFKKSEEELKAKPDDAALKKKVEAEKKKADAAVAAVKAAKDALSAAERGVKLANEAVTRSKGELEKRNARKAAEVKLQTDAAAKLAAAQEQQKKPLAAGKAVAFSANGKLLAVASGDNMIRIWNLTNGKPVETIGHSSPATQLAFASESQLLASGNDDTTIVWDIHPKWDLVATLGPADPKQPTDVSQSRFSDRVVSVNFSHNGKLLATGGGEASRAGELLLWDVSTLQPVREFVDAHSDTVFATEFSADDQFLASGAADKFVKVFNVATGKHVRSYEGHTHHVMDVSWKADGATLASAGADNAIKVWNVDTGEQRRTITSYQKQVTCLQFVGTDEQIVSGSGDKTIRVHKTSNGQNVRTINGSTDYVYSVASLRDLSIVIGAGQDGVLRVWDGRDGKLIVSFDPPVSTGGSAQANATK
jgi:WD40 repeat protein